MPQRRDIQKVPSISFANFMMHAKVTVIFNNQREAAYFT